MFSKPTSVDINQDFVVHNRLMAPDLTGNSSWHTPLWDTWAYGNKNFGLEARLSATSGETANIPVILYPGVYHFDCVWDGAGTSASTVDTEAYMDIYTYDGVQGTTNPMARAVRSNHRGTNTQVVGHVACPLSLDYYCPEGTIVWVHIWRNVNSSSLVLSGNYGLSLTRLGGG